MNVDLHELSDTTLLARYVTEGAESAFTEIVQRHLPLVFGTALRRLGGDRSEAEDVAQAVFVALARQASSLLSHPALAGWLYTTTVQQANNQLRRRQRRQTHEQTLMTNAGLNPSAEINWEQLQPVLDDALQELSDEDRNAVVLRYLEQRPFPAIGRELGVSEDAARMRSSRALEKLRARLAKRGLASSAAALGTVLAAQPSPQAPAGLANSIRAAVQQLPVATIAGPVLSGSLRKITAAALALLATTSGGRWLYLHQHQGGTAASLARASGAGLSASNRPHARLPFGRMARVPGAPVDSALTRGLSLLRSALFDASLGRDEKLRLLQESSELLVGYEHETLPILREALVSANADTVSMAIEATGHFGLELMREIGPELLALLKNPDFKDPDQAMLAANRLIRSLGPGGPKVEELASLLHQRPEFKKAWGYLLTVAVHAEPARIAENREAVSALLDDPNDEVSETAEKILAEAPEPPPPLSAEVVEKVTAKMRSADLNERLQGLADAWRLGQMSPEIRTEMVERLQHDPETAGRVTARQVLLRLAPDDPVLAPPQSDSRENRQDFLKRMDRNELSAKELLAALADRPAVIPEICERLSQLGAVYWNAHGEEKASAVQSLAALHQDFDARVFESAAAALESLDDFRPRTFYRFEELQPFFDAMEASLKPSEYAIAMRDLKPGVEAYWKGHGFLQPEPTHLSAQDVKMLLVGPFHQNRPAYDAMLEAIQRIDPKFVPPTP